MSITNSMEKFDIKILTTLVVWLFKYLSLMSEVSKYDRHFFFRFPATDPGAPVLILSPMKDTLRIGKAWEIPSQEGQAK